MSHHPFERRWSFREYPPQEMEARAEAFARKMARRRTTRHFSDRPVSRMVIEHCLRVAGGRPQRAPISSRGTSRW